MNRRKKRTDAKKDRSRKLWHANPNAKKDGREKTPKGQNGKRRVGDASPVFFWWLTCRKSKGQLVWTERVSLTRCEFTPAVLGRTTRSGENSSRVDEPPLLRASNRECSRDRPTLLRLPSSRVRSGSPSAKRPASAKSRPKQQVRQTQAVCEVPGPDLPIAECRVEYELLAPYRACSDFPYNFLRVADVSATFLSEQTAAVSEGRGSGGLRCW